MTTQTAEQLATYLEADDGLTETCNVAAAMLRSQAAEIANLHTVMMAAAVEITEHWDAHCDAEGYGPVNLVRRLENGFPAQYGYDAQTMVRMDKQLAEQAQEIERLNKGWSDANLLALEKAQEIERLRSALQELNDYLPYEWAFDSDPKYIGQENFRVAVAKARAALEQTE